MKISVRKFQRGSCLKVIFMLREISKDEKLSDTFNIDDLAEVRFKFTKDFHYIAWKKHKSVTEAFTIKLNILCESEDFPQQVLCYQNWIHWVKIGKLISCSNEILQPLAFGVFTPSKETHMEFQVFEVSMCVNKVEKISFAKLYEDDEFCDFNLNTFDDSGSVPVHKSCLIVHSDMFKRMLSAEWKETINGCIKIEGVTLQTLKYLKEYLYLGTLPDDTVQMQPLLLIAKCYMIENLKTECIVKLAVTVKPEELHSLQEFAVDHNIPELIHVIVQMTPDKTVQSAHQIEKDKEVGPPEAKKSKCDETS